MANWAIVIGIDKYWRPEASLRAAVKDALRVRTWLLDPNGGNVPPANLVCLLAPDPAAAVPPGVTFAEPTRRAIVEALEGIVARSGGAGERFFFHYSGHGLTARVDFSDEEALLPADFTPRMTTDSLSLRSITEWLEATQFEQQFLFIDGCRNVPWEDEFRIGYMPTPKRRDPTLPAVEQFVFYATSPGVKAAEIREAGNERGAFTDALLRGLAGEGKAKVWDVTRGEYVVRVNRLLDFVVQDVSTRARVTAAGSPTALAQVPRLRSERGRVAGSDPILAHFPRETVADATLNVFIDPTPPPPAATLRVERDANRIAVQPNVTAVPVSFALRPMEYVVCAEAPGYRPTERSWGVELYEPQQVTVHLRPAPEDSTTLSETLRTAGSSRTVLVTERMGATEREEEVEVTRAFRPAPTHATLTVRNEDSLALLEVADSSGTLIASGLGTLATHLKAGFYRARLRTPEGAVVDERLVHLDGGDDETLALNAPPLPDGGLLPELVRGMGFRVRADNTMEVSETSGTGAIAAIRPSTILTLAGSAGVHAPHELPAHHLRNLGLDGFRNAAPGATSGIELLFAADATRPDDAQRFLAGVRLRWWPQDGSPPSGSEGLRESPAAPGLAERAFAASPGAYWLRLELPGQRPVQFALSVLPDRLAMLVFERMADGQILVFQYSPRASGQGRYGPSSPQALRRLELLQRLFLAGQLDYAAQEARELLDGKFNDPIFGCVGGYLMLRLGRGRDLGEAVGNMLRLYDSLSDSHVLHAEWALSRGDEQRAIEGYRHAIACGLPILAEGLARLVGALHRFPGLPADPRLEQAFERRVRGVLWTAFNPP